MSYYVLFDFAILMSQRCFLGIFISLAILSSLLLLFLLFGIFYADVGGHIGILSFLFPVDISFVSYYVRVQSRLQY